MRFLAPVLALIAVASAQATCNVNCILIPTGGLQVTAGKSFTVTWSNPSSGQLTIKLQTSADITPSSGIILAANIDARTGSYTVQIPANLPAGNQFTFETIDQSNSNNINFSPFFSVAGATGVSSAASSTGSSSSAAIRSTSSGTVTSSSSSVSTQSTSTDSSSSRTSSQTSSRSSSSTITAATSAPTSGGASSLKVEGAALALIAAIAGLL